MTISAKSWDGLGTGDSIEADAGADREIKAAQIKVRVLKRKKARCLPFLSVIASKARQSIFYDFSISFNMLRLAYFNLSWIARLRSR